MKKEWTKISLQMFKMILEQVELGFIFITHFLYICGPEKT